jgi:hypothetical protein
MTIHVDLSPSRLIPSAVLRFVKEHAASRPPENMLFRVNREVFELYTKDLPKTITVSQEEADKIGEFLGTTVSADNFTLTGRENCSYCGRTLTFYDFFETGRKRHGDAFMRRFLGGGEYHIQVAGENGQIEVDCANCGTLNRMLPNGHGVTHYSGTIGGSAYTYV